jgi:site-specific DNA-cytosine methylase
MRVLVACEYSGVVRDAFIQAGHNAMSCDILPSDVPGPHHQGDVVAILNDGWDMMIAHPPCTHLAVSGAKHFAKKIADGRQQAALDFVQALMDAPIPRICIENPVSIISTRIRKPDQIIQPWQFGDQAQKTTCLWLKNLPALTPTKIVDKGEFYVSPSGKRLPAWYGDASVNGKKLAYGSEAMKKIRSTTFSGIADAMATQWGAI